MCALCYLKHFSIVKILRPYPPVNERVWCTLSDLWALQDAKCHVILIISMATHCLLCSSCNNIVATFVLLVHCHIKITSCESDWRGINQNCYIIKPKKSLKVHQILFPLWDLGLGPISRLKPLLTDLIG